MNDIQHLYSIFKQYPKITIDSRNCPENSIFFALKGEKLDGNLFAEKALENGCKYAVVDNNEVVKNQQYILVDNVLNALQELAKYHRKVLNPKIIAITGTNGKTTTKELIASVLAKKYNIIFTEGNLNNHLGVPLTLLKLTSDTEIGVIEMGANHIGEIAALSEIAQPNFGLITNIGKAHLEGFGSFEGVIKAKSELFDYVKKNNGRIFIDICNEIINEISVGITNISYGTNDDKADIAGHITAQNPTITLAWCSKRFSVVTQIVQTNFVGAYNAENLLAAISVGLFFEVEPENINAAISEYIPKNHRSQYVKTQHNELIIDAYNSNPSSMKIALENFASMNFPHKTVILGDMLELGDYSDEEHKNLLDLVKKLDFNTVFLIGKRLSQANKNFTSFIDKDSFIDFLKTNPVKNSAILIKSSNGIGLEKIIEFLR